MQEMTCQELVELITDYLEGALSAKDHARFEAHLDECDGCATYVDQLRTVIRLTGTITEESLPPDAQERLLTAFRTWRRGQA